MDNVKVETTVDNGRKVETRVYENVVGTEKERVVETHVEQVPMAIWEKAIKNLIEQVPMALSERVTEKIVPIVASRKKETYQDGKVIDTVVEELNHDTVRMGTAKPQVFTKEDLIDVVKEIFKNEPVTPAVPPQPVAPVVTQPTVPVVPVTPKPVVPVVPSWWSNLFNSTKLWEYVEMAAYVGLSGELAYCVYTLILKNWL